MEAPTIGLGYPLVAYNYRVLLEGIDMRFSKVDGLVWERKALMYRDGLSFLDGESIGLCRVDTYSQLTLQQGVVEGDTTLHNWLRAGDARWLQVQLCQADGHAVLAWRASRAVPIKLSGASLDAKTNDVFIDTLEIRAAGWSITHPL
ncbi:MAG: phage tail protein [Synechococcaceae cyanobacterium]|nr:phage tail protein [Synechococcaceae cyanobacterium]